MQVLNRNRDIAKYESMFQLTLSFKVERGRAHKEPHFIIILEYQPGAIGVGLVAGYGHGRVSKSEILGGRRRHAKWRSYPGTILIFSFDPKCVPSSFDPPEAVAILKISSEVTASSQGETRFPNRSNREQPCRASSSISIPQSECWKSELRFKCTFRRISRFHARYIFHNSPDPNSPDLDSHIPPA